MPKTAQEWQFPFCYSYILILACSTLLFWTEWTLSNSTPVFIHVLSSNDKARKRSSSADVTQYDRFLVSWPWLMGVWQENIDNFGRSKSSVNFKYWNNKDHQAVFCRHKDNSRTMTSVLRLIWTCTHSRSCCMEDGDQIIKNSVNHKELLPPALMSALLPVTGFEPLTDDSGYVVQWCLSLVTLNKTQKCTGI